MMRTITAASVSMRKARSMRRLPTWIHGSANGLPNRPAIVSGEPDAFQSRNRCHRTPPWPVNGTGTTRKKAYTKAAATASTATVWTARRDMCRPAIRLMAAPASGSAGMSQSGTFASCIDQCLRRVRRSMSAWRRVRNSATTMARPTAASAAATAMTMKARACPSRPASPPW